MDTSKKIIRGVVNSRGFTITSPITQWDYGWQFIPEIEDLPPTYRLDFSNEEKHGTALPVYCSTDGAEVPTELIDTGKDVWVWFVRIGDGFGITEYKWRVPNKCKPKTEQDEPTPTQQSSIDQLIVRSNEAVESAEQSASDASTSAQNASANAERAEEARTDAQNYATQAEQSATDASQSASQASASATASAQSATQAEQIKADVEDLVDDAQASASASAQSASASENSASQASASATSASQSASSAQGYASSAQTSANTASNKASEASTSAQTASTKASESAQSATNAQGYAQTAEQAKTDAQTAKTQADTARDEAVTAKTAAETAQGKAEDAQAAAESVAESIPSDYSQLSEDVSDLKEGLSDLSDANVTWIDGMYIGAAGGIENAHASYKCTDFIPVSPIGKRISFGLSVFANVATYALYDKDKHFISSVHSDSNTIVWAEDTVEFNAEGVMYVRFTTQKRGDPYVKASSHFTDQLVTESIGGTLLADGSISSGKLQDKSVVVDKLSPDVLIHDENTNFINYTKGSTGKYINKNGKAHSSSNVNATDFIPLTSGKTYYQNHVHNTYYAFYDDSYQFLTGYEQLGNIANTFTVPTGASFGRFTILDQYYGTEQAWISTKNAKPKSYKMRLNSDNIAEYAEVDPLLVANPCDYTGRDVSAFTKCICIGDSLTEGTFNYRENGSTAHYVNYTKNSYPTYFQKLTGIETVNKGHGGSTTIGWWNTEQNTDLSGFDMAIIQLGANDLTTGQTEWPAESKTALSNIISKLIAENNNIKVFVANIIPATSYPNRDHISTGIKNLVTELANPNVIFLDMAQYSHVGERTDYNCGHLSAYGYWRLAQDYANYIGHIMATDNADVFREIQFIGTNYHFHA